MEGSPSHERTWASDEPERVLDPAERTEPAELSDFGEGCEPDEHPERVGRYLLSSRVGSGSMGVVFSAWDPELERRVALKFIDLSSRDATTRHRVIREAKAMARLDHPNVVAIHDVGEHGGRIYLVMSFVAGQTLTQWLAAQPRSWREILTTFIQAGRGLAAAHAADLVHRDFKLDNVMIDERGQAQVLDFGLARASEGATSPAPLAASPPRGPLPRTEMSGSLDVSVTRHGALVGTPAYMAPELFIGQAADARSDQFAFGVALYKALYDQRPYGDDSVGSLLDAMTLSELHPPPRGSRVPAALHAIVVRALACTPAQRWPDMQLLVTALEQDPARTRSRLLSLSFLLLFGLCGALATLHERPAPMCEGADAQLAPLWNAERSARVAARFNAAGPQWTNLASAKLETLLDSYTTDWRAAHHDACAATHLRGEQSERVLDLRMRCLAHGQRELGALVEVLESGDDEVLARAVAAAEGLPRLSHCADLEALARSEDAQLDDPEFEALAAELDRALVLLRTAQYTDAQASLDANAARVEALQHLPTQAAFAYARARLLEDTGDYAAAAKLLEQAFHQALRSDVRPLAAEIATSLTLITGERLADPDAGWRWLRLSESLSDQEPRQRARLLSRRATLIYRSGSYAQALEVYREAIELLEDEGEGDPGPDLAALYNGAGLSLLRLARTEEARPTLERAIELMGQTLGIDHPKVASTLLNLAAVEAQAGELAQARDSYTRAIAVLEAEFGPDHPNLGVAHINLAGITRRLGQLESAQRSAERGLRIYRARFGLDHPKYAIALAVLARVELARGQLDAAEAHARTSVAIVEAKYGDAHTNLVRPQLSLVRVLLAKREFAEALALSERALINAGEDPIRADIISERERILRLSARAPGPIATIDDALHICDELVDCGSYDHAELLFARARVRDEPLLAARALKLLETDDAPATAPAEQLRAQLREWLASRSD